MRRARANICCNSGDRGGSAALRVFHCCRSTTANISSSRLSSSSNANTCSAGRWMLAVWPRLAKSVHSSIRVWSFLSFFRYFLSSGSDWPRTNCSLISSWRALVSSVGSPVDTTLWWNQRRCLRPLDGVASGHGIATLMPKPETLDQTGRLTAWRVRRSCRVPGQTTPGRHSSPSRRDTKPSVVLVDPYPIHARQLQL